MSKKEQQKVEKSTITADKEQSQSQQPSNEEKKPVFEFSQAEYDLLGEQNRELKIDDDSFEDLLKTPDNKPQPSDKELDAIVKDPKYKTTVISHNEVPSLLNTLGPNDRVGKITDSEVADLNAQNQQDRKNLIILLASKDHINLDIHVGDRNGKAIFTQKPYYYKSITKKDDLQLKLKNARLTKLNHKYTILINKDQKKWTDEEEEFIIMAQAMMEIAAYQLAEYEAWLKLGMPAEDFSRVELIQYGLALQVLQRRNQYPSFSSQEQ